MNCTPTASFSITNRKFKILLLVFQDDKENFSREEFGREGMEFCAPVPNTLEKCKNSALFLRLDRPSNRKRSLNRRNLETPILCFSVDVNILRLDRPSNRKRASNRRNLETPILCFKTAKYEIQKPSTCREPLFRCKFSSMFPVFHLS